MNKLVTLSSLCFLLLLSACATTEQSARPAFALGDISAKSLLANYRVFSANYQQTKLSESQKQQIQQWPAQLNIISFFGSWCHDSQREVPVMIKIMQQKPSLVHQLIALDYVKSEPKGRAKAANIQFTPTFVVRLGTKEIGRIIERPKQDLVADITALIHQAKS